MTPALAYWVDRMDPFLVRFTGNVGIRYYGLAYGVGFLCAAWLLHRYAVAGRSLLASARIADFMLAAVVGVVLGGRIGSYILYDGWRSFGSDPFAILRVWEGGMASHGGMIGVVLAAAWFARSSKIPFLHLADLVATTAPAGLFFGRIANFINGELWGRPSTVPWAVIFPRSAPADEPALLVPRHPSQLYEAALEGALLFAYMQWRFWRSGSARAHPGRLAGEFLILYALVRILCEAFREPDASLILGMSRGTFYSLFMIAFGLVLRLRRGEALVAPPP
ncbi:MAG: prolipoprotein diacylglyceryl transferase [Opitutaceae bacterium]|jgi:phosphatidylglycerol:prolipoprotein diacylglycerol transferase